MESSLASLFMEGNLPCLPLSWATSGESVEELQQQLTSTTLELQSVREAARFQSRIHEAKIFRLQGLLDVARKERDEARTKCSKLRECLSQLSHSSQVLASAEESPNSGFPSSLSSTSSPTEFSHPASPTTNTMSFQDLKQSVHVEDGLFEQHDVAIELSLHHPPGVQDVFVLEHNADLSSITTGDCQQQFSMEILNEDVSFNEEESLDLIDLEEPRKSSWDVHASDDSSVVKSLLRQSSTTSSAGSGCLARLEPMKAPTTLHKKPISMSDDMFPMQSAVSQMPMTFNLRVAPEFSMFDVQANSTTMQLKAAHVETLEHDAGLSRQEDALPEKGKLLQAVMQAGPLLQNLLLAGPLPQWRYPPPQLSTVDIPKVPMPPGSLPLLKYPPSLPSGSNHAIIPIPHNLLMNHSISSAEHVSAPQFPDEKGVLGGSTSASTSMFASKSGRNMCYGGRKLRRLSPIGVK